MNKGRTSTPSRPVPRENILGTLVSAIGMRQALGAIEFWVSERASQYVTVTPAHALMDAYRDPDLRRIVNQAGLTTPDGMSVVWLLKLLGHKHVERVYGPDLLQEACRRGVAQRWRHFFYGGDDGVAEELTVRLKAQFPELQVAGFYHPPFRPLTEAEDRDVVRAIRDSRADIVWVGLGSPKQEFWMAEHLGKLDAPVMIGVGAAFDFLSGRKPQAPRWIQRSGLEWLFRLAAEPRRLWPRYRHYPKFVLLVLSQLLRIKKFPIDEAR